MSAHAVRFRFLDRGYEDALADYFTAREFVLAHGLFGRPHLGGFINAPWHPDQPRDSRIVPEYLVNDPRWHVAIVAFTDDAATLTWIESLPLPPGCVRSVTEAGG